MNRHPKATLDLTLSAIGNFVIPPLLFGISWWVAKWLIADGEPQWGTPLFWASALTIVFIYLLASQAPPTRPPDASPNIPPLTKTHLAIKMGLATLYTVICAVILGMTSKPVFPFWMSVAVPVAVTAFALFEYRRLYQTYCKDHVAAEST